MTEIEDRLRTMLQERAQDVTEPPARVTALPTARPGRTRHVGWLVAAAAVLVLAVATLVAVSRGGDRPPAPPATHPPTKTGQPPAPSSHAPRKVKLAWFGMSAVPGFVQHVRLSDPGHRTLALRARADQDVPIGCNGCEQATDYVVVFDAGAFSPAKYRVSTWSRTKVAGRTAYLGKMAWYGAPKYRVPTVAWEFRPGEWAIVQGVTPLGGRPSTLKRVAAAVQPTVLVPIELPFRLDYVPDAPITQVTDDRSEGYAFTMDFSIGRTDGLSFDVTLWKQTSFAGAYDTSTASRRDIGGLPGWIGEEGIGVRYHGGIAVFGMSNDGQVGSTVGDRAAQTRLNAQRQLALERVARGIHWTNGDGRAPLLPAEQAIP